MNAEELQALLRSARPPALLHVLPAEVFAACRIPGSLNACVFETAFLDQVKALGLDPAVPLVVYGAGEGSLDAVTAAEKLGAAGYSDAQPFPGGIDEWKAAGQPLEGTGQMPRLPVPNGAYRVDTAQSVIRWTGRNLFNDHHGTVRLGGGEIHVRQGKLSSARFIIDMASVLCEDLGDPALNAMLLAHLRTADFFDVERHSTAEFVAEAAEPIEASTEGTPNFMLSGTFTLRGISRPLEFPVLIAAKDDGQHLSGQGILEFDRTEYGSRYGSGKLFRFLGQHVVNDFVQLHVKIHADCRVQRTSVAEREFNRIGEDPSRTIGNSKMTTGFWSSETLNERLPTLISPFSPKRVKHAAYEMALGGEAFVTGEKARELIPEGGEIVIPPGQFAVLITEESISVPPDAIAFISMKSANKFRGLINISGFHVDPGFSGCLLFSVFNAGVQNIHLSKGVPLFMIWFASLDRKTADAYSGGHNGQKRIPDSLVTDSDVKHQTPSALQREIEEAKNSFVQEIADIRKDVALWRNIILGVLSLLIGLYLASVLKSSKPDVAPTVILAPNPTTANPVLTPTPPPAADPKVPLKKAP